MAALLSHDDVERRELEQHEANLAQEKQNATITTNEVADESLQTKWKPGVKARFPWLGFVALCVMLLGIAFTVTILKTSDGKKQEEWPVKYNWARQWSQQGKLKPSSTLAGVNTMFNIALAIAIANGITIAWWRKAMRGATVKELHESWSFSTSSIELLTAGKAFNIIALGALTAKFALLDGILLQQASGTEPGFLYDSNVPGFRFPIVQELPSDYLGNFSTSEEASYSKELSVALYNYYADPAEISFEQIFNMMEMSKRFDTKCVGSCELRVPGFGIAVKCTALDSQTFDVTPATLSGNSSGASTLVDVAFSPPLNASDPSIEMLVSYASNNDKGLDPLTGVASPDNTDCTGSLIRQTCTIRPAIMEYMITVLNSSTQPVGGSAGNIRIFQPSVQDSSSFFTYFYAIEEVQPLDVRSELTLEPSSMVMPGIYRLLTSQFATHITQSYSPSSGFTVEPGAGLQGSWWGSLQSDNLFPGGCSIAVVDPSQWIVTQMNNILFRLAMMAATDRNGSSDNFKVPHAEDTLELVGDQTRDTIVYTSDYKWMGGAIGIMALCVICVLPVYWGFWELGRKVTMGPMEIASAFQAPVLSSPGASAAGGEVNTLLKEVGQRQVRYGEIDGQIAVAEMAATRRLVGLRP